MSVPRSYVADAVLSYDEEVKHIQNLQHRSKRLLYREIEIDERFAFRLSLERQQREKLEHVGIPNWQTFVEWFGEHETQEHEEEKKGAARDGVGGNGKIGENGIQTKKEKKFKLGQPPKSSSAAAAASSANDSNARDISNPALPIWNKDRTAAWSYYQTVCHIRNPVDHDIVSCPHIPSSCRLCRKIHKSILKNSNRIRDAVRGKKVRLETVGLIPPTQLLIVNFQSIAPSSGAEHIIYDPQQDAVLREHQQRFQQFCQTRVFAKPTANLSQEGLLGGEVYRFPKTTRKHLDRIQREYLHRFNQQAAGANNHDDDDETENERRDALSEGPTKALATNTAKPSSANLLRGENPVRRFNEFMLGHAIPENIASRGVSFGSVIPPNTPPRDQFLRVLMHHIMQVELPQKKHRCTVGVHDFHSELYLIATAYKPTKGRIEQGSHTDFNVDGSEEGMVSGSRTGRQTQHNEDEVPLPWSGDLPLTEAGLSLNFWLEPDQCLDLARSMTLRQLCFALELFWKDTQREEEVLSTSENYDRDEIRANIATLSDISLAHLKFYDEEMSDKDFEEMAPYLARMTEEMDNPKWLRISMKHHLRQFKKKKPRTSYSGSGSGKSKSWLSSILPDPWVVDCNICEMAVWRGDSTHGGGFTGTQAAMYDQDNRFQQYLGLAEDYTKFVLKHFGEATADMDMDMDMDSSKVEAVLWEKRRAVETHPCFTGTLESFRCHFNFPQVISNVGACYDGRSESRGFNLSKRLSDGTLYSLAAHKRRRDGTNW